MKAMPAQKKDNLKKEAVQKLLRKVSAQEAFYFSREIGDYTGEAATSLAEFAELLRTVDARSIDFHMERQDFERWIRNVLGDEELAQSISRALGAQGEDSRNELVTITTRRVADLSRMLKTQ